MIGTWLGAAILVVAVGVWWRRPRRRPAVEPWEEDRVVPVDREELEAAEREARRGSAGRDPDEELPGDDWGPGASR